MTKEKSRLITLPEAGKIMGVTRQSAYRYATSGKIPTTQIGCRLFVSLDDVKRFQSNNRKSACKSIDELLALEDSVLLTLGQAGTLIGIARNTVYENIKTGRLQGVQIKCRWFVSVAEAKRSRNSVRKRGRPPKRPKNEDMSPRITQEHDGPLPLEKR